MSKKYEKAMDLITKKIDEILPLINQVLEDDDLDFADQVIMSSADQMFFYAQSYLMLIAVAHNQPADKIKGRLRRQVIKMLDEQQDDVFAKCNEFERKAAIVNQRFSQQEN